MTRFKVEVEFKVDVESGAVLDEDPAHWSPHVPHGTDSILAARAVLAEIAAIGGEQDE